MDVPQNPCNPKDTKTKPFGPHGPRGWQDEYCEWSVTRDAKGNITAVDFTHENPEYWFHMWRVSPDIVLSLYQEILNNREIKMGDLYLYDRQGNPVIVRETGLPAYNPINKWNKGSVSTPTGGGAIHLTSPPNSLGAEIYLGAAATILRVVDGKVLTDANELICAAKYGQIYRNSDPRIGQSVNSLVYKNNVQVTLTNPIALYGQEPNFNLFTLPPNANKTIKECYSVVRGAASNTGKGYYPNNMILHSRFAVPADANFRLSDIKVNGVPLKWGSQIADTFDVQLAGTGIAPAQGQEPQKYPPVGVPAKPLPNVQYVLDYQLLRASLYNRLGTLSNLTSCITEVAINSSTSNIAILTNNAQRTTQFNFGKGINVVTNHFQDLGVEGQLFLVTITVDGSVALGQKPLALFNNETDPQYTVSGVLEVVSSEILPAPKAEADTQSASLLSEEDLQHLKTMLK